MGIFSLFFETAVVIFISYIRGLEGGLGTRAVACAHFAVPAFTFSIMIFFYDETRKIFVRNGLTKGADGRIKITGWMARNTIW